MGGNIILLVGETSSSPNSWLINVGSTEHWGPVDEDALDQQDIRLVLRNIGYGT
jgi:hypothetical protein